MKDFLRFSYQRHENHYLNHAQEGEKEKQAKTWLQEDTVDAWRHLRMYNSLDPLIISYPEATWLTIGDDRYGNDAHYLREKGLRVLATDISDILLKAEKKLDLLMITRKKMLNIYLLQRENLILFFAKNHIIIFPDQ